VLTPRGVYGMRTTGRFSPMSSSVMPGFSMWL
jgi:hypothetical protein